MGRHRPPSQSVIKGPGLGALLGEVGAPVPLRLQDKGLGVPRMKQGGEVTLGAD